MVSGELTVHTSTAEDLVRAYLADFRHQTEWRDDVLECELVSGAAGEDGAVYRQSVKQGPGGVAERRLGARIESGRGRIDFQTLGTGPVLATGTNTVSSDGSITTVHGTIKISFSGSGSLLRPVVARVMKRRMVRYEQALKAHLDALGSNRERND